MKKRIIYTLLILWMSLIFFFSNQPAIASDKVSGGVIEKIVNIIEIISNHKFNDNELEIIFKYLIFPIRKLAHFILYFILGILFYNIIRLYSIDNRKTLIISLLFCIIYACSDEIHQLFISGRSGELRDVFIDTLGSLLGILIVSKIINRKYKDLNDKV